uniref:Uncharacterized protein n=1 Tax=Manihot esculenta TaxID=3983 RepID=A0A2C9VMG4_MANES
MERMLQTCSKLPIAGNLFAYWQEDKCKLYIFIFRAL